MASRTEMFPPKPKWTEKDIHDQHGRVFIVTGGSSGCGYEVAKALYNLNGRVYIANRNVSSATEAIETIKSSPPAADQVVQRGKGELFFLRLDLANLSTIKASAEEFLGKEERLDVIWHNAGVMAPPVGILTKQGHDMQLGTNVLGPFLFQQFLTPICLRTAKRPDVKPNATRVIFVSSSAHRATPKPDGVDWTDMEFSPKSSGFAAVGGKYGRSKAMNVMHAHEFARRYGAQGLISLSLHPGALKTNLQQNLPSVWNAVFGLLRYPQHFGGLTELWAGLNTDVDAVMDGKGGKNGGYVVPWGRFGDGAAHVFEGLRQRKTGERLWEWTEGMVREYA